MAVSAAYPGLPTTMGATAIQSTTLTIPTGEYQLIDWNTAMRKVNDFGRSYFLEFPNGKQPDPSWQFYTRSDMTGSSGNQKTIVGVNTRTVEGNRAALNTTTMQWGTFPSQRKVCKIYIWHVAIVTLSNGSTYPDVTLSMAVDTVLVNPEDGTFLAITNGYQGYYEASSLLYKPVAGTTPLTDPMYAALAGLSPNV